MVSFSVKQKSSVQREKKINYYQGTGASQGLWFKFCILQKKASHSAAISHYLPHLMQQMCHTIENFMIHFLPLGADTTWSFLVLAHMVRKVVERFSSVRRASQNGFISRL